MLDCNVFGFGLFFCFLFFLRTLRTQRSLKDLGDADDFGAAMKELRDGTRPSLVILTKQKNNFLTCTAVLIKIGAKIWVIEKMSKCFGCKFVLIYQSGQSRFVRIDQSEHCF